MNPSSNQNPSNFLSGGTGRRIFLMMVLLALHSHAERVNVAKYQPVTASGQNSTYSPDFAVDGIVSNFHSYRTANSNNPHWLEIRYPRAVTMGSAHLYLGLDNDAAQGGLPTFKLQYHDGSAWVDIPGATVTVNTNAERVVVFQSAVTAERIRLYSDENGIRTIREIAVFPPNLSGGVEQGFPIGTDVRLSLAHKRPTAASAIRLDAYPKKVVDGYVDDSSRWLSPATAAGDTLEVDLIIPHAVGSLHLYSGFGSNPV
ncbi:MAG: discoidin domain-containing protein, partial [Akkermansiaceae bacterium]|nr:discoidin domain-containing protein [Akkermansiaceae bacterium]